MKLFSNVIGLLGLAFCLFPASAQQGKDSPKGTIVKIDNLQAVAPADWKPEKPANRLRSHQFRLPRVKEDKEDAELAILPNVQGTPDQNIERWKEMFLPPDNKTIDEVSRVATFKYGSVKLTSLDVAGTYLYKDRPLSTKKAELKAGYRGLWVIFDHADGGHLIRLIGPARTVDFHQKAFDSWLKSFK